MNTKSLIALAAALVAGFTSMAPEAEAGGGIRLGFGGPMGSFIARPTQGYASSYARPSYGSPSCNKSGSSYRSATRSYERPAPKKPVSVASRKQHDDDEDDDKPAKAKKKLASDHSEKSEKSEKSSDVKQLATNSIPLEATKPAVAKPAEAPVAADLKSAVKTEDAAVKTTAATPAKVESAALVPATAATAAPVEVKAEPKVEAKPAAKVEQKPAKTTEKAEKKSDCRRFVPSAGITVSVRCND